MIGPLRCVVILAASALAAQTTQPQAPDLSGEAPLSVSQMQLSKINLLTVGLLVSTDFDDNALSSKQGQQGNLVTLIQPRLAWRLSRARLDWAVEYTPGLSRSQSFSAYDSISHQLDSGFQLKVTKRLRLRVHESFLKSANPFDQLQGTGSAIRNAPNDIASATPAEVRTERGNIDLVYAVSAHSAAGVGGELFSSKYNLLQTSQPPGQVLQDARSGGGHAYYTRHFTRHQWAGVDYHVQKLIFNSGQSWSFVHSMLYTHTVALSPLMTISVFAGPEKSLTENVTGALSPLPGQRSVWHLSGGVTGTWSGVHTSLTAKFSKRVSNGGILGAVELSTASLELSRQLARQWTGNVLASYDKSRALVGPGALSYGSAAWGLMHTLGPNLSVQLQYWREHLSGEGSLPAAFLADHNRISMSVIYDLRYPLGR